jgi:hypothetical protein
VNPVTANQTYILDIIPKIPPRNRMQAVMFAKPLNIFAILILLKLYLNNIHIAVKYYFAKPSSATIPPIKLYMLIAIAIKTRIDRSLFFTILMRPVTKAATAMPARAAVKA